MCSVANASSDHAPSSTPPACQHGTRPQSPWREYRMMGKRSLLTAIDRTFLKRKGGLFKKAHELSVLCSVDVAVIIFGHNKKLYEFSSGDINETIGRFQYVSWTETHCPGTRTNEVQYGGAHEHKGPADFSGRNIDDDDDDDGTPPPEEPVPTAHHGLPSQMQNPPNYSNLRHTTASPPVANGVPYHHRSHTPQPQIGSRPASRNNVRRPSSNLGPQPHQKASQAPPGSNGYAYMQNQPVYNPHAGHGMPVAPHHGQPQTHQQQFYGQQQPQHSQVQQAYRQDQRPSSVPPSFSQEVTQPPPMSSPPQPEREPRPQENQPNRIPKPIPAKSRSIFTPIDDSRSLLAQHWGIANTTAEPPSKIKTEKDAGRSQSVDLNSLQRSKPAGPTPPPPRPQRGPMPQRTQSTSALGDGQPPSRTNSAQLGAKRPRLKVQIPSEQSDGGSATAESSPRQSAGTAGGTPAKASTDASHSSGVVLPPPSPSASAILSAGAQGPPNPFARPHPPPPMNNANSNSQPYNTNNNIETPISALPSRFVADALLPSPSSFYPEWGFGRSGGETTMLPSPLNFPTPVIGNGPSFLRDEDGERKRKSPEGDGQEQTNLKRLKT